jgi:two-component system, NarL family, response regulator NreC
MPISIVLADDHPVVRRGLRALLGSEPGLVIVGEAGDGLEAVRIVERLRPDVLLLDLMMPGLGGLEVLRVVRRRAPATRVAVLSMHNTPAFVAAALLNGATGYLLKGCDEGDLIRAVREVAAGRRALSPTVTDRAIDAYIEQARAAPIDPHDTLSTRERQVLQLVAEGNTGGEIAARLHISPRTVENHRANLMRKLALKNHSDLVRYALRRGLIPLDE